MFRLVLFFWVWVFLSFGSYSAEKCPLIPPDVQFDTGLDEDPSFCAFLVSLDSLGLLHDDMWRSMDRNPGTLFQLTQGRLTNVQRVAKRFWALRTKIVRETFAHRYRDFTLGVQGAASRARGVEIGFGYHIASNLGTWPYISFTYSKGEPAKIVTEGGGIGLALTGRIRKHDTTQKPSWVENYEFPLRTWAAIPGRSSGETHHDPDHRHEEDGFSLGLAFIQTKDHRVFRLPIPIPIHRLPWVQTNGKLYRQSGFLEIALVQAMQRLEFDSLDPIQDELEKKLILLERRLDLVHTPGSELEKLPAEHPLASIDSLFQEKTIETYQNVSWRTRWFGCADSLLKSVSADLLTTPTN